MGKAALFLAWQHCPVVLAASGLGPSLRAENAPGFVSDGRWAVGAGRAGDGGCHLSAPECEGLCGWVQMPFSQHLHVVVSAARDHHPPQPRSKEPASALLSAKQAGWPRNNGNEL